MKSQNIFKIMTNLHEENLKPLLKDIKANLNKWKLPYVLG